MCDDNSLRKLGIRKCQNCGKMYSPPRYHCSDCGGSRFIDAEVIKGTGEVYSWTRIRIPYEEFLKDAPYTFAIIKLDEGLMVPGRFINDGESVADIGSKVRFVKWDGGVNWFETT